MNEIMDKNLPLFFFNFYFVYNFRLILFINTFSSSSSTLNIWIDVVDM